MATRDIKTRLKLEGEAEYKKQLGDIDSTLKVLRSEMKKVSAEYEDNADSLEALSKKNEIYEKQLEEQQKKVSTLREVLEKAADAWGETDRRTQSWAQRLNNAEADLYKIQGHLEKNQEAMRKLSEETDDSSEAMGSFSDALKDVADKLGIQLSPGVEAAIDKLDGLNPKVSLAATGFALVATALSQANEKLKEITSNTTEYYTELEKLSQTTGVNRERLQEFEYAAGKLGVPMESLSDSLKDVTNKAYDAANGNEDLKAKFEGLGVSILNTDGQLRDSYSIFLDLIDALGEISNQTERDALAMELINEGARELNPLIDAGSASFRKYSEEARNMSLILSDEQVGALHDVRNAQLEFEAAQKAVSDQMAAEYAPHMEVGLMRTKELLLEVGDALEKSGVVNSLGSIANSVGSMLEPLAEIGMVFLPAVLSVLEPIAAVLALIADAVNVVYGALTYFWGGAERIKDVFGGSSNIGSFVENQPDAYGTDWDRSVSRSNNIYRHASGTPNFPGGVTWVGENGPERVWLPAGSQIDTAQESRSGSGDVINVYVSARDVQEFNDLVRIAKDARRESRMKGGGKA